MTAYSLEASIAGLAHVFAESESERTRGSVCAMAWTSKARERITMLTIRGPRRSRSPSLEDQACVVVPVASVADCAPSGPLTTAHSQLGVNKIMYGLTQGTWPT